MNTQIYQNKPIKVCSHNTIPSNYIIKFVVPAKKEGVITIGGKSTKQVAELIAKHMDIVGESRKLISEGKVITWDENIKTHEDKK